MLWDYLVTCTLSVLPLARPLSTSNVAHSHFELVSAPGVVQSTHLEPTQSCFTYTVWTFFCSRVVKKITFFKPLPFPLKIVLGQISSQSFLLIFSSILRQITTYTKMLTFWENLEWCNSWKHSVDVCKSTQCFKFLHSVDIFCSQVHTWYVTQNHNCWGQVLDGAIHGRGVQVPLKGPCNFLLF